MSKSTHCVDAVYSKKHPVIFQNHPLLNCRGLDQLGGRNIDYKVSAAQFLEEHDWAWQRQRKENQGGARKVRTGDQSEYGLAKPPTTSGFILEWCFRDLNQSGDSSSLSSDDDEVSTSPAGVTTCQSSGPGWILCFLGKGSSALQCTTRQNA